MSNAIAKNEAAKRRSDKRIAIACVAFFFSMVGLAYASVPLYQLFCQVTGFGGTTQRAELAPVQVLDQKMHVRFDANMGRDLAWEFEPVQREVELNIGETVQISYKAKNILNTPSTGTATFNVTPAAAGAYFNKMACFCFTETTLAPGEEMDMPVVFFIDPDIVNVPEMKDITTITLSYTFFAVDEPAATADQAAQTIPQKEDASIGADASNTES